MTRRRGAVPQRKRQEMQRSRQLPRSVGVPLQRNPPTIRRRHHQQSVDVDDPRALARRPVEPSQSLRRHLLLAVVAVGPARQTRTTRRVRVWRKRRMRRRTQSKLLQAVCARNAL